MREDILVLPDDVELLPVIALAEPTREAVGGDEGDHVVTRARGRRSSHRIDAEAAGFLRHFREPRTLLDAVLAYCEGTTLDPFEILEGAYPLVRQLRQSGFLVRAGEEEQAAIRPEWATGDVVHGIRLEGCVHVLSDTEVHRGHLADGTEVAVKLLRRGAGSIAQAAILRELEVVRRLEERRVRLAPRLVAAWTDSAPVAIVSEWIENEPVHRQAAQYVAAGTPEATRALGTLVTRIANAYGRLHAAGVLHGDVHPKNVLVTASSGVRLVDFGAAQALGVRPEGVPLRAGVPLYYEPELAAALLAGRAVPHATAAGEQHALATMLFLLITGHPPVALSFERDTGYRQIASEPPRTFAAVGARDMPPVEAVLHRALAKDPAARFPSMHGFARALREAFARGAEAPGRAAAHAREARAPRRAARGAPAVPSSRLRAVVDGFLDRHGLRVLTANPGSSVTELGAPHASVYHGAAGIAYALLRIAILRRDPAALAAADAWITRARAAMHERDAFVSPRLGITPERVGHRSLFHGDQGVHLVDALVRAHADDEPGVKAAMRRFLEAPTPPGAAHLDMTSGLASELLGVSVLQELVRGMEPSRITHALRARGDAVVRQLWDALDADAGTGNEGPVRYLGVAHGTAGICLATLRWMEAAGADAPTALDDHLAALAERGGTAGKGMAWPRERSGSGAPWPGWCHGSAGYVLLWQAAARVRGDDRWNRLALGAAEHVWESGAAGGESLCCGTAGQSLSLMALGHEPGDRWQSRALARAAAALDSPMGALLAGAPAGVRTDSDPPVHSLFKGATGIALVAAELEGGSAHFPFSGPWGSSSSG